MFTKTDKNAIVSPGFYMILVFQLLFFVTSAQTDSLAAGNRGAATSSNERQLLRPANLFTAGLPKAKLSVSTKKTFLPYTYRYNTDSKSSKTIINIIGVSALTLFGEKTNHPYRPAGNNW